MKNFSLTRWTLRTAIVLLSGVCVVACSGDDDVDPIAVDDTNVTSIKIAIAVEEDQADAQSSEKKSKSHVHQKGFGADFTFSSVASIKLDVLDATTSQYFTKGSAFLESSPGVWEVTLPFLPKGTSLTFVAHAFDGDKVEIFTGSVTQTLTTSNGTVTLPLAPSNNGETTDLPAIKKITIPADFVAGQTNNITFSIKGLAGDDIDYTIDTAPGGGSFAPATGGIKLYNVYGSFVAQYTAPVVVAASDFDHAITITNPRGNSVTTTFTTHVVPQGSTNGTTNTTFKTLFNPVINHLSGQRFIGTNNVLFTAAVSDDGPLSDLSYQWTFAPSGNFNPTPDFIDDSTNGTTLTNYTEDVAGTLTLAVSDADGGITTIHTQIMPDQFVEPTVTEDPTGLNSLRAGGAFTCAMLNTGAVRCWGAANYGQLGYGNTFQIGDNEAPATAGDVALGGILDVATQLTTGGSHSCALLKTGLIRCWGRNNFGQLGYGDKTGAMANLGDAEAIDVFGYVNAGSNAVKVVAGANHTCAILDTGNVRCWGDGALGKLGYGNTNAIGDDEQPYIAGDVSVGGPVKDLALGLNHTCALLTNGNVRCWGQGVYGQLGYGNNQNIGDNEQPSVAGDVNVGGHVVQISAGDNHTCARLDTGNVRCWGLGTSGQLGYSAYVNTYLGDNEAPVVAGDVNTGGHVLQVSAGGTHTCVLLATGDVKCWGSNASGQLGNGQGTGVVTTPPATLVDLGGSSAMQITTGQNHTCALLSSGKSRSWGAAGNGQLGYGNTINIGDNELASAGGDINILTP